MLCGVPFPERSMHSVERLGGIEYPRGQWPVGGSVEFVRRQRKLLDRGAGGLGVARRARGVCKPFDHMRGVEREPFRKGDQQPISRQRTSSDEAAMQKRMREDDQPAAPGFADEWRYRKLQR